MEEQDTAEREVIDERQQQSGSEAKPLSCTPVSGVLKGVW